MPARKQPATATKATNPEPLELSEWQLNALARCAARLIRDFYKNPENMRRFEEWERQRERELDENV